MVINNPAGLEPCWLVVNFFGAARNTRYTVCMAELSKKEVLWGMKEYRKKLLGNIKTISQVPSEMFGGMSKNMLSLAKKELAALDESIRSLENEIDAHD